MHWVHNTTNFMWLKNVTNICKIANKIILKMFDFDVTPNQGESVLSYSDWSEWFIVMHWQLRREGIYE